MLMTIEEKKAYVDRITEKAVKENITFKEAAKRLDEKVWCYYKFKSELRQMDNDRCRFDAADGKNGTVEKHRSPMPFTMMIRVNEKAMTFLEREADRYATDAEIVAQLLLHECIEQKTKVKIDSKPIA